MIAPAHNPNRSLVRIFGLALNALLLLYSMIAVYGLFALEDFRTAELAIGLLRVALGPLALFILLRWGWDSDPFERVVTLMGAAFEADFANQSVKTRIRSIVIVTILSLLLELVLIRW